MQDIQTTVSVDDAFALDYHLGLLLSDIYLQYLGYFGPFVPPGTFLSSLHELGYLDYYY